MIQAATTQRGRMVDSVSTRERILDAASSVFADEGFAGARVDEIARRAGINKAMLYYHVGNKQALYTAVLMRNFAIIESALAERSDTGGPAGDRLQAVIGTVTDVLRANPDHPKIVLREFASGGANLPDEVLGRMLSIFGRVRELLAAGTQSGEFRRTDPIITHLTVVGASLILNAAAGFLGRAARRMPDLDFPALDTDVARILGDLLLNGIAASPGTGEPT
jgi:TetR/AcrR family transcriptional regulator